MPRRQPPLEHGGGAPQKRERLGWTAGVAQHDMF
jgi:hypothetical protein